MRICDKKQRVVLKCHHVLMLTLGESANLADPLRSGGSGGGQLYCKNCDTANSKRPLRFQNKGDSFLRTVVEREWVTSNVAQRIEAEAS